MNPTIAEAFRRAILKGRNLSKGGEAVTMERITAVLANEIEVSGSWGAARIPVTGEGLRTLRAGGTVAVGWERGRPVVAIAHTARRSGAPVPAPGGLAPLVEKLLVATRPDGVRDVYFRNFDAVTALRLDRFISSISTVKWGPLNDRFFVQSGTRYFIFKFDRTPDEPFGAGTDPSALVSLERTENLATNMTVLATVTTNRFVQVGSLPFPDPVVVNVPPSSPLVALVSASLDTDGNLIGSFRLNLGAIFIWTSVPAANFAGGGMGATLAYPIVADLTNRVVLLSAFDQPAMFAPLWPDLIDYNHVATIDVPLSGAIVRGIPLSPTWVSANSFTAGIDPPFEGHTEIVATWQVGYVETPNTQLALVDPILVLGTATPAAERVRGFVAWTSRAYGQFIGQTFDVADWNDFIDFNGDPAWFLIAPTPPFDVTPQAGAIARGPLTGATVALYALGRPAGGLSFAPTWHRVVWRKPATVAFQPADGGLDVGGADSPGFAMRLEDGATAQISPTLRASVGKRGLVVLPTDFLYQLDNPVTALPESADVNFFVDGWAFGGPTTLDTSAADFPVELTELSEAKALADLPAGVIQPTSAGLFSLYVNNAAETLSRLGLFEDLPS